VARGWESKSVEQQQDEIGERGKPGRARLTPAEQERNRKREGLELSRKRLIQQREVSKNQTHREMLEKSIAEIERQLASFGKDPNDE
jgi:antitoxin (DNA-binding transcriptional repressor) of toxin-antitoxin stability system